MTTNDAPEVPTGATGRTIVVLDTSSSSAEVLLQGMGVPCVRAGDPRRGDLGTASAVPRGSAVVLEHLGIAIVEGTSTILTDAAADPDAPVLTTEPEVWVHAIRHAAGPAADADRPEWSDTETATWGLLATRVMTDGDGGDGGAAAPDGAGIRVAVLDTGIDATHPDLADRVTSSRSFIPGEEVQDGNGHGSHVAGTIGGPVSPAEGPRYGVAPGCELLVGKVLSDAGSGTSGGVLEGMNWAIEQGAQVISMSLGSAVGPGEGHLTYYETAARAALAAGAVIVAAAGNEGWQPVGSPANCPSVLAVAALDQRLQRAEFSCVGLNGDGGEVNVAAPGVAVHSSWPVDQGSYAALDGTSMATPHVSGLAALAAAATGLRGQELWDHLVATAEPLPEEAMLVGSGLTTVASSATSPGDEAGEGVAAG